jgi:predicted anti-sigma-YlaC factor YlaD
MGIERCEEAMGISCQEVWKDVSDYIDDELEPLRRAALDEHFAGCRHCTALLEGMRNVIAIYRDERVLAPPDGFHDRLQQKLEKETRKSRRRFLAWSLAAAAAVPLAFAALSARKFVLPGHEVRSPATEPDGGELPDTVAISQDHDDKVYHVAGCSHLIGKVKFLTVKEAIREGYKPCAYCIAKAKPKKTG